MLPEELGAYLKALGQPAFRAKQVFAWLNRGAASFDEMSDLPKALRERLKAECDITPPEAVRRQVSAEDGTIKYLWRLRDGNCIETVLMRYKHGNTVCVSCEVGCSMGCVFCASTLGGKVRNLTAAEILEQVIFTQKDSGAEISNIVMMGIGEPLDNFDEVLRFLTLVNHPDGMNIGMRHISLSTCGLVKQIDKLAQLGLQLTLSVSLHAPDDETRSRLMPVNRAVHELSRSQEEYHGMGTTLVAAIITGERIFVANVGDSRCYQIREGTIQRISRDHSLVEDLVERGEITREEARHHPKRNLITRALGVDRDVKVDLFERENCGGYLLLCSDGLSNLATEEELRTEIVREDKESCCSRLLQLALDRGAPDNVTAVVVQL